MRTKLFCAMALLAAGAAAPASAGKVYIPVVDRTAPGSTHETEILLANAGAQERRYELYVLPADTDGNLPRTGGIRTIVFPGRTVRLTDISAPGTFGLVEIDAAPQIAIDARLAHTPATGPASASPVPVISSQNALAAGATAHLLGLVRTNAGASSDLGVVNLDRQSARCGVSFVRADGSGIGGTIDISVKPLALSHFTDVLGILGENQATDVRVRVSCNRTFYAYATVFNPTARVLAFATPAATGASTLGTDGSNPPPPPPPAGDAIVFESRGLVHTPAVGNESRVLTVPVSGTLSLRRLTIEWDVTPGAWAATRPEASHNMIWVHRGDRYRSNTLANVNAFGPPRSVVRSNQNIDLGAGQVTSDEEAVALQQGVTYHFRHVYDAESRTVTLTISADGQTIATFQHAATARNGVLVVPATGLSVHFGHGAPRTAQSAELPTYGWEYRDLRIEMLPY
jgi:hypothetical protein